MHISWWKYGSGTSVEGFVKGPNIMLQNIVILQSEALGMNAVRQESRGSKLEMSFIRNYKLNWFTRKESCRVSNTAKLLVLAEGLLYKHCKIPRQMIILHIYSNARINIRKCEYCKACGITLPSVSLSPDHRQTDGRNAPATCGRSYCWVNIHPSPGSKYVLKMLRNP